MTNTNPESFSSDTTDLPEVEATEFDGNFIDTPGDPDAEWAQPGQAFRFLNWVADPKIRQAYSVNLPGFSTARQEGVRDLVNHSLVSERRWVGGEHDGRVTYRLTSEGELRLQAAREAAALIVVG